MTINISKPEFNLREKLSELDRPVGNHGVQLMRSHDAAESFNLVRAGRKNMIINGSVIISQRNGTSNTTIASSATYGPDRISARTQTGSSHTLAQTADGPDGFKYSAKVTIGTGGSPSAGNKNYLYQPIEGYNVAHLGGGTSTAKTVTLSFWVKSSLIGKFGAAITSGGSDQSYTFPYTINSANTWEKKTKTITLSKSGGTWNTNNTAGLTVFWDLGSGSDYEGTANQWNSALDVRSSSDVKLMATNSATWYVTGIQLEEGNVATPFEHRPYGEELALCQRYYWKPTGTHLHLAMWSHGVADTGGIRFQSYPWPVPMRATPSLSYDDNAGNSNRVHIEHPDKTDHTNISVAFQATTDGTDGGFKYPYGVSGFSAGQTGDLIAYNFQASSEM